MQRVNKAIKDITVTRPWIGRILKMLPKTYSDTLPTGQHNGTMATNGKALFINPDFAKSLAFGHVKGVLVHEAIHVIQRHALRRGTRDPELYAIAIDAATNAIVMDLNFQLPEGRVDPVWGETVEQIYARLAQNQQNQQSQQEQDSNSESDGDSQQSDPDSSGQAAGQDQSADGDDESGDSDENSDSPDDSKPQPTVGKTAEAGDVMDYPLEDGETMADAERKIDQLIAQASLSASMDDAWIGSAERDVFERIDSELSWPNELQDYIHLIGGAEYSMNPPHIGLGQQGIICNQLNPTGCGNVVLAVDVSGSIDRAMLDLALSHLMLFVENMDYESLRVIACSSYIKFDREFSRGETVDLTDMETGGGTRFSPVFDLISEGQAPDLLVYFSDMHVHDMDNDEDPGFPIVWLVDDNCFENGAMIDRRYNFCPNYGHAICARQ